VCVFDYDVKIEISPGGKKIYCGFFYFFFLFVFNYKAKIETSSGGKKYF
jgi:hypothetical protein